MTGPIAAVVFDMDGTLLDTEGLFRNAFMRTAARFGLPVSDEAYLRLIGIPTLTRCALLAQACDGGFAVDAFCAAYREEREAMLGGGVPVKPGAYGTVTALAARGVRLAVATSASRATALAHLGRAELLDLFDAVVGRDDVGHPKPAPDAFKHAVRLLRATPAESIAVEDSMPGLRAASAAGLRTVLIPDLAPLDDAARQLAWRVEASLDGMTSLVHASRAAEPAECCAVADS